MRWSTFAAMRKRLFDLSHSMPVFGWLRSWFREAEPQGLAAGASRAGEKKLTAELTIRAGRVMWDLNGRAATDWKSFKYQKRGARP